MSEATAARAAATPNPAAPQIELEPRPAPLSDCSPEEQVERRFVAAANAMLDDAAENGATRTLADVLAWTLARIAVGYGNLQVGGDIVVKLGHHMSALAARRAAAEEAEQAKEKGHKPH